jgi:hypothetical protein
MEFSKEGWTDCFELDDPSDADNAWRFTLLVTPGNPAMDPPHCFIATLTITKDIVLLVHRSEHHSLSEGVIEVRAAAKRAEALRRGPEDE